MFVGEGLPCRVDEDDAPMQGSTVCRYIGEPYTFYVSAKVKRDLMSKESVQNLWVHTWLGNMACCVFIKILKTIFYTNPANPDIF